MSDRLPDSGAPDQVSREEISRLVAELREALKPPAVRKRTITAPSQLKPGEMVTLTVPAMTPEEEALAMQAAAQFTLHHPPPMAGEEKTPGFTLAGEQYDVEWPGEDEEGGPMYHPPTILGRLDRLAYLLGLSEQERAFVRAAADSPTDHVNLQVFADWLEDAGRPDEAESVRRLTPEDGSVLVYRHPSSGWKGKALTALRKTADAAQKALAAFGRRVVSVFCPDNVSVQAFPVQKGDVLVLTHPNTITEQARQETLKFGEKMQAELKALGREVFVCIMAEGFGLVHHRDRVKILKSMEAVPRANYDSLSWNLGVALGEEKPEVYPTAEMEGKRLASVRRLRADNDALKAELAGLLREKRERMERPR